MQPFQIPSKYHPFTKDFSVTSMNETDAICAKHRKIAKYAPRVLKSYMLTYLNDLQTICAIKRVKRIRSIQDDSPMFQYSKHQWRLLLQNKFKTVLAYDHKLNRWEPLEKYKAFLNITQVLLWNNNINKNLLRYVPAMSNIKCLDLQIDSDTHPGLLKKLNSMPFVLSKLTTLKMRWSHIIPFNCETENIEIQKYLTHLFTQEIKEYKFLQTLKQLLKYCKNLVFLSTSSTELPSNLRCSYLELLSNFEKLEAITIFSDDLEPFIKNFTLPTSIKDVCINLGDVTCSKVYEELFSQEIESFTPLLENSLIEKRILASFFEKWKDLANLISLKISSTKRWNFEVLFLQDFIKLILKSVPNLVNFEFDLQEPMYVDSCDKFAINLSQIFTACQNYYDKIQEVKLSFPMKASFICPFIEGINFPNLTLLQLQNNRISNVKTLQNIFRLIKKPAYERPVKILLGQLVVKSNQKLLNVLEVLRKTPRNSKTELTIEVEKLSLETFDKMFEAFIEKVKKVPAIRNVSLKVKIYKYFYNEGSKVLSFLNEMFQDVQFKEVSNVNPYWKPDPESDDKDEHLDLTDEE